MNSVAQLSHPVQVERLLGARLIDLQRFGKPTLGVYGKDGKWHAAIEMNVNVRGGQFKIATDFNHATPDEAVERLESLVKAALRELQTSISTALATS